MTEDQKPKDSTAGKEPCKKYLDSSAEVSFSQAEIHAHIRDGLIHLEQLAVRVDNDFLAWLLRHAGNEASKIADGRDLKSLDRAGD